MNRTIVFTSLVILLLMSGCSNSKKSFDKLSWIEGKWESTDVKNYFEVWKRVNDTCYEGLSVSPTESDSLVEERSKIVRINDTIHFISEIEEQTVEGLTQDFVLTSSSPDSMVFSNKDLHYPNMITYKKMNDTLLKVAVEHKNTEGPIKFEYTLKKVKQ
jgi:subtilase family serine protease